MKGTKPAALIADDAPVPATLRAPTWMSRAAKAEWKRVLPALAERRILTVADLGCLENYCVAIGRSREVETRIQYEQNPDDYAALARLQDKAMATARLYAAELGLTPVSRSRPAIRAPEEAGDDPLAL